MQDELPKRKEVKLMRVLGSMATPVLFFPTPHCLSHPIEPVLLTAFYPTNSTFIMENRMCAAATASECLEHGSP